VEICKIKFADFKIPKRLCYRNLGNQCWCGLCFCVYDTEQGCFILNTQVWKQTSGDPSGQTWNYCGMTLLYNFMTALLYMVSSVTMARIVAMLLDIY